MNAWTWLAAAATLALPAMAQYKVVQPDGSIAYTDRPPAGAASGAVTSIGRRGVAPPDGGGVLPLELRQAVGRYPVTLYSGENCPPCDEGRQLLIGRGVPYAERRVLIEADAELLARISGGRTLPSLTIGAQPLRGFNPADWASYLDAAGYPRDSKLPRGWQPVPATPLAPRAASSPASAAGG